MNDNLNGLFAQQGWQCPICKRVYSPFTQMCFYCGQKETTTNKVTINDFYTTSCGKESFAPVEQTLNETIEKIKQNKL